VTLINVAAQGYETVAFLTWNDFNGTNPLWYDRFIPKSQQARHRNCTPTALSLDQCIFLLRDFALT